MTCKCGHAPRQTPPTRFTGFNACDCCGAESPLYDLFATCRECLDHFCPACSAKDADSDEKGCHTICWSCAGEHEDDTDREDDPHERAAAHARSNDFEDTDGNDWT